MSDADLIFLVQNRMQGTNVRSCNRGFFETGFWAKGCLGYVPNLRVLVLESQELRETLAKGQIILRYLSAILLV